MSAQTLHLRSRSAEPTRSRRSTAPPLTAREIALCRLIVELDESLACAVAELRLFDRVAVECSFCCAPAVVTDMTGIRYCGRHA